MLSPSLAQRNMAREAACLRDIEDVRRLQSRFIYHPDQSHGFPTIVKVFQNQLQGDCASAAVLGQWALAKIGIPATKYLLTSSTEPIGHAITISDDHRIVIGNITVVEVSPEGDWQSNVFALWSGAYNKMQPIT